MTHFALASFQMKKKTLKLSRLPHYLAITNHSTVQFPVGFSLRQMFKLPGALLGRQVEEGIPSFFFPLLMMNICLLFHTFISSGDNMPAAVDVF